MFERPLHPAEQRWEALRERALRTSASSWHFLSCSGQKRQGQYDRMIDLLGLCKAQLESDTRLFEGGPRKGDNSIGPLTGIEPSGVHAIGRNRQGLGGKVTVPVAISV